MLIVTLSSSEGRTTSKSKLLLELSFISTFLVKVNSLSKVGEGQCAYEARTLEIYRPYEQPAMTQADFLSSLALRTMKNRQGAGAVGQKSGNHVHMVMAEARDRRD